MTYHVRILTREPGAARRDLADALARAAFAVTPRWQPFTYTEGVVELAIPAAEALAVDLERLVDDLRRRGYDADLAVTDP